MEHWALATLDVEPHKPQILQSARGEGRSIVILSYDADKYAKYFSPEPGKGEGGDPMDERLLGRRTPP